MTMTKGERDDLARLIRKREQAMKSAASQRAAELLADFEQQISTIHDFDRDEVWKAARASAAEALEIARADIARRCEALGIPKEFAPGLSMYWHGRGENAMPERRAELRRAAKRRIEAMEASARTAIELHSVEAQTQLVAGSLTSDAAREFMAKMPAVDSLMPKLEATSIAGLIEAKARGDD